ncbi:unnamed protein product [Protopolystoma xenopodis]|uniref:USP domain-containing protein n=1 Tax=Protopolystoma xenopodis TaxID=117903 RepID=A0A448WW88_9PLAT|nr:unnamed protein product [Protopolystoma xenopodis]
MFCSYPDRQCFQYRLCGMLLHIGRQSTSGHYVAVIRDASAKPESVLWTVYNDAEVCSSSLLSMRIMERETNS